MPPLASNRVGAGQNPAIDDNAAADAGAENDAEDAGRSGGSAIDGFGKSETVGIVGQPHFALQHGLQVAAQGLADQAGRVGVLDQPAGA